MKKINIAMNLKSKFKSQRNIWVVLCLLFVISVVIIYGIIINDQQSNLNKTRIHGTELARILSEMPYEQLIYDNGHNGILAISKYYLGNPQFAYSVITDAAGVVRASVKQDGIVIPYRETPADASSWLAEYTIELNPSSNKVIEFQAPIFTDSELNGFVRIAFFKPTLSMSTEKLPFFASIALSLLLIAVLFLYLLRQEMKPLKNVEAVISDAINNDRLNTIDIRAEGALAELISKLNHFIQSSNNKISYLSQDKHALEASAKLLSYQQAKIQSVLHAMPEGLLIFDEDGVVAFSNDKVGALFGVERDAFESKTLDWCDNEAVKVFLTKVINHPLSNFVNETVEFVPQACSNKNYIVQAYPLFTPKDRNQLNGILVLFRDYTEESLAKHARGEFVAHVAHELKNPLNVLAMYSESLLTEQGESAQFRIEAVNVIQDEVERLSMLINNLLSITKIELGSMNINRQRVKLKDFLEDIYTTTQRSATNKELNFECNIPNSLPDLFVDKDLLRIAFNNILSNAVKYSNQNGTISLIAEEVGQVVNIKIADTGIGIGENEQSLIFDKFFRSNSDAARSRTGHGLGLSLVKDIIELHHGTITVNSKVSKGTVFTITLDNSASLLQKAS